MGACISLAESGNEEPVAVERPPLQGQVDQVHVQNQGHDQNPIQNHPPAQPQKPRLSQIDPKQIPDVLFKNQIIDVFVYEVFDGDTLHFLLDTGGEVMKLALRLIGIDTPEVHAGKDKLPQEKVAGKMAREYLKTLASGHQKIRITDWDKYGSRVLGEVILEGGETANAMMIKGGYAKPYHGEKKQPWTLEELMSVPFSLSRDLVVEEGGNE